jgi:hypothetical protein
MLADCFAFHGTHLQNACLREPRVACSHHITLDVSSPVYNKAILTTDRGDVEVPIMS